MLDHRRVAAQMRHPLRRVGEPLIRVLPDDVVYTPDLSAGALNGTTTSSSAASGGLHALRPGQLVESGRP